MAEATGIEETKTSEVEERAPSQGTERGRFSSNVRVREGSLHKGGSGGSSNQDPSPPSRKASEGRGGEPEEGERTEEVEEIRKERLLEAYSAYCSANLHTPRPVPPRKIGENGEASIYGQKEKKEKTVEACEVRRHGQAF